MRHPLVLGVRDVEVRDLSRGGASVATCLPCAGAHAAHNHAWNVLRQSVEILRQRMARARRVMIVGNGGIALEAAYGVRGVGCSGAAPELQLTLT